MVSLVSSSDISLPRHAGGSAPCIRTFETCSAFTHVTACVLAESPKVTRYIEVLRRKSLPSSPALIATGWSNQFPGGSCTH
jgi:hypothetical protein